LPGGRRSKAEELGLGPKRQAFLRKLEEINLETVGECVRYGRLAMVGLLGNLISTSEADVIQKVAATALRGLRSMQESREVAELRALRDEMLAMHQAAATRATRERTRAR
jgi:hypothetical protein